ncbi:macrophage mannose receptor 1 [Plakobranchus ocellatus]|uniref:Macrophage mannose receptor 1 n=1 Tax=Plakobranchus ocellatus TaxID=259542 RepID=A0AAV4DCX5_9GAST|nr:macrophage mannose receptor 1 [Plakobranchus ocellatus]
MATYGQSFVLAFGTLLFTATSVQAQADTCPSGWTKSSSSGTCIKFYDDFKTWADARTVCQQDGGDLVTIRNENMSQFVEAQRASKRGSYWIGLHDLNKEGDFGWLDETQVATFLKWGPRQPNDMNISPYTQGQDCVEIGYWNDATWNDKACEDTNKFLCEKPATGSATGQDCVEIGYWGDERWNDKACEDTNKFVCEKPAMTSATASTCPSGWTKSPSSGTCIKFYDVFKTWADARTVCQQDGGDLVTIRDENMSQFVEASTCPSGWTKSPSSGTCIKFYDDFKTWADARTVCQQDGGDLVTIRDENMSQFVEAQRKSKTGSYWIGLHDLNKEGDFGWLDETQVATFLKWGPSQPNDMNISPYTQGQDCVEIGYWNDATWNDKACEDTNKFVCEKPAMGSDTASTCPSGWTKSPSSGTCIKFYDNSKTWADARTVCQQDGGDLVTIRDANMNQFVEAQRKSKGGSYWIGLHDLNKEGDFGWLDETQAATFLKWGPGQPNDMKSGQYTQGQDCVEIGYWDDERWNDKACAETNQFICEKPAMGSATASTCPSGWTKSPSSGTCIKFYDDSKTWADARTVCQQDGGDLVTIRDANMNQFVEAQRKSKGGSYWIGLHDLNKEGDFGWLDETQAATFLKWGPGQPNDMKSSQYTQGQDCVEIGYWDDERWNDKACAETNQFICEKPAMGSATASTCPSGWTKSPSSGTCIKFYDDFKTWADARTVCQQDGGDLVTIRDENMSQFVEGKE